MNRQKLFILVVLLGCLSACTKPNPDACCTNEAECLALGSSELRPCDAGRVCSNNQCFEVQCETAAQCAGGTPYCVNQLCVGSCKVEADCGGVPGAPLCADDQVCVGCRGNADCSGATPICDAEDRACRGCETDGDCASGVCLEADGVCAKEEEIVFLSGGADTGECTRLSPCASLPYALSKVTAVRPVIRLLGSELDIASTVFLRGKKIYIDSVGTKLSYGGASGTPMFVIDTSGRVTMERVVFSPMSLHYVTIGQLGFLRLWRSSANNVLGGADFFSVVGGNFLVQRSEIDQRITCSSGGAVSIESTRVGRLSARTGLLQSTDCVFSMSRSTLSSSEDGVEILGGVATIENNLFLNSNQLADFLLVKSAGQGSRFAFNTIVNTSGVVSEGVALTCDASAGVVNNIIAYRSSSPHTGGCPTRYTLYDDAVSFPPGEGNLTAPFSAIFVDPSSQDFRPSVASPARGMAGLGVIPAVDHDGRVRPLPAGTKPDVGAFEVP